MKKITMLLVLFLMVSFTSITTSAFARGGGGHGGGHGISHGFSHGEVSDSHGSNFHPKGSSSLTNSNNSNEDSEKPIPLWEKFLLGALCVILVFCWFISVFEGV